MSGHDAGLWLVARSTGLTSYLMLTLVTISGTLMARPGRTRTPWLSPATRIRVHVALSVFVLSLVAIHVVVLSIDPWAKVGWAGALLPFGAEYRPLPVTWGLMSVWAGLVAGLTAGLSGRFTGRIWRPLHRVAAIAWLLAWIHGVFAGSDTGSWWPLYLVTGMAVVIAVAWRIGAPRRGPVQRSALSEETAPPPLSRARAL